MLITLDAEPRFRARWTVHFSTGEAAARAGVAPSALRYWERRGLVQPARQQGHRRYGRSEMRRIALFRLAGMLGFRLTSAATILDASPPQRLAAAEQEIHRLDDLIERARAARQFMASARDCPERHQASDCPSMQRALDLLLDGVDPKILRDLDRHPNT